MKTSHAILLALLSVIGVRVHGQGNPPLKLLHTTPFPDFKGDMDHFQLISKAIACF
jgi:hypothetical protein